MTRICFVGNELFPITAGGAGLLINKLARMLVGEGHEVVLLLDVSKASIDKIERDGHRILGDKKFWRVYQVDKILAGSRSAILNRDDFLSRYTWESFRYDLALREVYDLEKPQIIEFVDYCGAAYFALNAKICGYSYQNSHIAVRIHGPLELIDRSAPSKPLDFDRYSAYALERASFRLAESVLTPIPGLLETYYGLDRLAWFGQTVTAPPPPANFPARSGEVEGASLVLFYGRLFAVKGVNRFVEAAVDILERQPASKLKFILVGYDSMEPPSSGPLSYKEYLLGKIPKYLRDRFIFTGQLDHHEVAELLPQVRMAVFPAYFESFGYAAQEMKLAGLPLILSDIPAFRAAYQDGVNGLFFDGSAADLARKIEQLDVDRALRQRLGMPHLSNPVDPLVFYREPTVQGWVNGGPDHTQLDMLVCIIADDMYSEDAATTLASVQNNCSADFQVVFLERSLSDQVDAGISWFMDEPFQLKKLDAQPIHPSELVTCKALLILRAGDKLMGGYPDLGLEILARQPQISFVCTWKLIGGGEQCWIQTHPLPAMLELAPLEAQSLLNRCIIRTPPGINLFDMFDERNGRFTEVEYLWRIDNDEMGGVLLPEALVQIQPEFLAGTHQSSQLAFLFLNNRSTFRQESLTRYLTMLSGVYPGSLLPLQSAWAQKSGFQANSLDPSGTTFIAQTSWRRQIYLNLSKGGVFSQTLLKWLMWAWFRMKGLAK